MEAAWAVRVKNIMKQIGEWFFFNECENTIRATLHDEIYFAINFVFMVKGFKVLLWNIRKSEYKTN